MNLVPPAQQGNTYGSDVVQMATTYDNGRNLQGQDLVPCSLYLNSKDAVNSGGVYRWEVYDPYLNQFNNYEVGLVRCTIPNLVYPINSNNNKIYLQENGGATLTFTVPSKNYTGTQLATQLQSTFNAAPGTLGTYTVTFDTQRQVLVIAVGGGANIQLVSGTNNLYREMGFYTIPSAFNATLTSDYPIQIGGSNYIQVIANFATSASVASSLIQGVASVIPLTQGFGEIVFFDPQTPNRYVTTEGYLSSIQVYFKDESNNYWIPPPTVYFEMTFQIKPAN